MLRALLKRLPLRRTWFVERHAVVVIIAGAIAAMLLSLAIGLRQSIWFDEAYSILLAKQSLSQLLALTAVDTHPPLYYLLLKMWASVFGWSELALRSLSLVMFGATIALAGLFMKRLFGARVALISLVVMMVSPFLLRYGFEIRMYATASLIGIGATYVLILAQSAKTRASQWRRYALYSLLVAAGMYTLYYMALLWLAHVVWLIWLEWQQRRSLAKLIRSPWLAAYAGAVILFVPWLPTLAKQLTNGALTSVAQPMTVDNLMSILSFYTVYQPAWQLGAVASLLVVFASAAVGWLLVRARRTAKGEQYRYLMLLVLYTLVPVAFLTLVGLIKPMYLERYMAHVAIGGSLLVGVMIGLTYDRLRRRERWVAGALVAIFVVGTLHLVAIGNYNFQRLLEPSMKQAASAVERCNGDSRVLAADPYAAIELNYYLASCPVYFYGNVEHFTGGYAPLNQTDNLQIDDLDAGLAGATTLYLVYYDEPGFQVPARYVLNERTTYGSLVVERFSVARRG